MRFRRLRKSDIDSEERESNIYFIHSNIARLTALYCVGPEMYVVYEHTELDILDLAPLSITEIATVASQVPTYYSNNDFQIL
jgi:hypothetical protein